MRKVMVIASREYKAAVRTKAFIIGMLIMPLMMGGSILVQTLLKDVRDVSVKKFAVIDRTPRKPKNKDVGDSTALVVALQAAANVYNESPPVREQKQAPFELEIVPPRDDVEQQRFELSERVRSGELSGFLEIGSKVMAPFESFNPKQIQVDQAKTERQVRYQTNQPTFRDFVELARITISKTVQFHRVQEIVAKDLKDKKNVEGYQPPPQLALAILPVDVESTGLSEKKADGTVGDATKASRIAPFLVPFGCVMLMFMLIMMTATPMMQGVVEEKMQRIAEVLLGSVRPFQLMLGKLIGMTGVSLSIGVVYLTGALWAADHYGFTEYLPWKLIVWFVVFQMLAAMTFGSLFIAVGAACTDMKETQNLMWPVMLLAVFPMFLLQNVITEPNGSVATGASFFPFATPVLMVARMAIPPGIPTWQPFAGVALVLATTLLCVFVAGRIFRVGILLQGKGAKLSQIARWVLRG